MPIPKKGFNDPMKFEFILNPETGNIETLDITIAIQYDFDSIILVKRYRNKDIETVHLTFTDLIKLFPKS